MALRPGVVIWLAITAMATVLRNDDFLTRARFRRGASRLGTTDRFAQPKDDFLHDNVEYGRYSLAVLL